jgi:small subunit ribosomal protein S13
MGSPKKDQKPQAEEEKKKTKGLTPEEKQEKKKQFKSEKKELQTLVRVLNTDLDGDKNLMFGLQNVKGVSHTMSKAVCTVSGFDPRMKLKMLKDADIEKVESIIREPTKFGIPLFLINRRRDVETGAAMHVSAVDMETTRRFDIQRMVDAKSYKGTRHMLGLPCRGQRTRSSFRKGRVVGVVRKAVQAAMTKKPDAAAAPAAPAGKEAKK